jgi:hypothetical protein
MVRRLALVLAICLFFAGSPTIGAEGSSSKGSKGSTASRKTAHVKGHTRKDGTNSAVTRHAHGRIQRSDAARHAFARRTGYPNGRPGYIIDHIVPLACGGADDPSNMQWQTIAQARSKDKTERIGCR